MAQLAGWLLVVGALVAGGPLLATPQDSTPPRGGWPQRPGSPRQSSPQPEAPRPAATKEPPAQPAPPATPDSPPAPSAEEEPYVPRPLLPTSGLAFTFFNDARWTLGLEYMASELHGTFRNSFNFAGTPDRLNAASGLGLGTGSGARLTLGLELDGWRAGFRFSNQRYEGQATLPRDFQIDDVVFSTASTLVSKISHNRFDLRGSRILIDDDGWRLDLGVALTFHDGNITNEGVRAGGGVARAESRVGGADTLITLGLQRRTEKLEWGLGAEASMYTLSGILTTAAMGSPWDPEQRLARVGAAFSGHIGVYLHEETVLSFTAGVGYERWKQLGDGEFPDTKREYPAMVTMHIGLSLRLKF